MKTFSRFVNKNTIKEGSIAFSYNDGGTDQTVLISGSASDLKKVEKKLPAGTNIIKNVPSGAMEISASEWLKIK